MGGQMCCIWSTLSLWSAINYSCVAPHYAIRVHQGKTLKKPWLYEYYEAAGKLSWSHMVTKHVLFHSLLSYLQSPCKSVSQRMIEFDRIACSELCSSDSGSLLHQFEDFLWPRNPPPPQRFTFDASVRPGDTCSPSFHKILTVDVIFQDSWHSLLIPLIHRTVIWSFRSHQSS